MQQPKVILLDAVGTLFGVRGSVGEVYRKLAAQVGVEVDATTLNQAFIQSFQSAPKGVFPGILPAEIPNHEFAWWQAIATQSFQQAGVLHQFSDFPSFFAKLYAHFATAAPWFIYPDVQPALAHWRSAGVELGIISNFDRRLYLVLKALNLARFFTSFTISTEVGFAKPEPQIFTAGLKKHYCTAANAWYIGDSWGEDYQAAKAAGLAAFWLQRDVDIVRAEAISTLTALLPTSPG